MKAEWRIRDVIDDVEIVRRCVADRTKSRERGAEGKVVRALGDTFRHSEVAKDDSAAARGRQRSLGRAGVFTGLTERDASSIQVSPWTSS